MDRKGFSLIELMVVIGIISILLGIATLNFNQWIRRCNIEKEVKELYADMMSIRQQAMVTGMSHRAKFETANSIVFRRYSSEGDALGTVVRKRSTAYAVSLNSWTKPSANEIEFDTRGMMTMDDPDGMDKEICFFSSDEPALDGIVITQARISVGKINNQGNACVKTNITLK